MKAEFIEEEKVPRTSREPRGISSIEVGGQLLLAMAHLGRPLPLGVLAREAGMVGAKAHPYLVSFVKLGLIQKDPVTGYYSFGPLALQVGLISLQQVDPIQLALAELPNLARMTGQTVGVAIWGNRGPTFVRLEEGPAAIHINMRHGTVVSVLGTATGRLFAAFKSREVIQEVIATVGEDPRWKIGKELEAELINIRDQRFSILVDGTVAGITAMSAPVFDVMGNLVIAITAIGPSSTFDSSKDSAPAQVLKWYANSISQQLGAKSTTGKRDTAR